MQFKQFSVNSWLFLSICILSLIPIFMRIHLLEKDFLEILGEADGLYVQKQYCFIELNNYAGLPQLTGLQARPPLVPLLLTLSFALFGHTLKAIYIVYFIPRFLIFPFIFLIALNFFKPRVAFCVASLPIFFPFFDTYALSTLKADVFVVAWSLSGIYFHLRWKNSRSKLYLFLSSVFLSLNILSKETALYFSVTVWALQVMDIVKLSGKKYSLISIIAPVALLILPFIGLSVYTTGRLFPSLFATAFNPPSFYTNLQTYVAAVFYYAGVFFGLSKTLTLTSIGKVVLILLGMFTIIKKQKYELIFPVFAVLISISFIHARVIQGEFINREILHRIALLVPFTSFFIVFGLQTIANILFKKKSNRYFFLMSFIIEIFFINQYFTAPYALDYSDREFYINANSIFSNQVELPWSNFRNMGKNCVINWVPARNILLETYKSYKVSAFPQGLKELLIGFWFIPLVITLLPCKRLVQTFFK